MTLAALMGLFSTVRHQMLPQMACFSEGEFTLVAFVGPLSSVRYHVSPQATQSRGGVFTLVAFVQPFSMAGLFRAAILLVQSL